MVVVKWREQKSRTLHPAYLQTRAESWPPCLILLLFYFLTFPFLSAASSRCGMASDGKLNDAWLTQPILNICSLALWWPCPYPLPFSTHPPHSADCVPPPQRAVLVTLTSASAGHNATGGLVGEGKCLPDSQWCGRKLDE